MYDRSEPFNQINRSSIQDQNGNKYSFASVLKDGRKTWRCNKRKSKCKCRAYVQTQGDLIIRQIYEHSHESPGGLNHLEYHHVLSQF